MARVDDHARRAARRILGVEDNSPAGEEESVALEAFYALAQLTPEGELPGEAASRVKTIAASSAEEAAGSGRKPAATAGERVGRQPRAAAAIRGLVRKIGVPLALLALLIAGLAVSVGVLALRRPTAAFRPQEGVHLSGTAAAPDAAGLVLHDGDQLVLFATGLAELTSGNRYVAWALDGEGANWLGSLTSLATESARLVTRVTDFPATVIVTIESTGTPSQPVGPPVLTGSLPEP